jgi:RimJ/RimL family protein N-acetyltransferase
MTIPTLTTERLILRGFRREDFAGVYALWSDPRTGRLMGMQPMSEEDCWAKFLRSFGAWQVNGFGFWAVEEKASGNFVGELGFLNAKRAIEPPLPVPEMGWSFSPSMQGRGYATEGVAAAIRWGEDHFGRARFSAIIAPENEPPLKLARKFGFAEVARTTYKDHPTIVLYREP